MYVSIDGKIDGSYMEEDDRSDSGDFYDEAIWQMGNANGSGRVTAEMYFANHEIDYAPMQAGKFRKGTISAGMRITGSSLTAEDAATGWRIKSNTAGKRPGS